MSPLIQKPDIALRLKKFLGLTNLPDSVLAPEVVATVTVGDLTEQSLDRKCAGSSAQAASVGNLSLVALRNQPAAGTPRDVQVKATQIIVSSSALQEIRIGNTGAALGALVGGEKAFRDNDQVGQPSCELGNATPAAQPAMNVLKRIVLLADTPFTLDLDFLFGVVRANLFQNSYFAITTLVNTTLHASFEWIESSPDPS